MADSIAHIVAGFICLSIWAVMAAAAAFFGHVRTKRVEGEIRHRAEPAPERVQLFYAGASVVWLSALVLAVVGFARREWTRMGRNCLFIFLGHITVVILLVLFFMPQSGTPNLARMAIVPCAIVGVSALVAGFFALRWSRLRAARIAAEPASDANAWGAARYGLYFASLVIWPVGFGSALVLNKPENVRVGATAFVFSMVQIVCIALLVCIALPLLIPTNI